MWELSTWRIVDLMANWALHIMLSVVLLPALAAVGLILRHAVLGWGSLMLGVQARILGAAERFIHTWFDQNLPAEPTARPDLDKAA